jgi:hypothetical protein
MSLANLLLSLEYTDFPIPAIHQSVRWQLDRLTIIECRL